MKKTQYIFELLPRRSSPRPRHPLVLLPPAVVSHLIYCSRLGGMPHTSSQTGTVTSVVVAILGILLFSRKVVLISMSKLKHPRVWADECVFVFFLQNLVTQFVLIGCAAHQHLLLSRVPKEPESWPAGCLRCDVSYCSTAQRRLFCAVAALLYDWAVFCVLFRGVLW